MPSHANSVRIKINTMHTGVCICACTHAHTYTHRQKDAHTRAMTETNTRNITCYLKWQSWPGQLNQCCTMVDDVVIDKKTIRSVQRQLPNISCEAYVMQRKPSSSFSSLQISASVVDMLAILLLLTIRQKAWLAFSDIRFLW